MTEFESEKQVKELYTEKKQEIVLFQDTVYDVSAFKTQHPGGVKIIEEHLGQRIDEPFRDE